MSAPPDQDRSQAAAKGRKRRAGDEEEEEEGAGGAAGAEEEGRFVDGRAGLTSAGTRSLGVMRVEGESGDDDDDDDESVYAEESSDDDDDGAGDEEGGGEEGGAGGGAGAAAAAAAAPPPPQRVFRPGVDALGEGETLEMDASAYVMYHAATAEWPCLSLDVLPDRLGPSRTKFPLSATVVAGSQADIASRNALYLIRFANLRKTQPAREDEDEEEDESSSDDDSDDEGGSSKAPQVHHVRIPHAGGVNRVRVMATEPHIVASQAETGKVHLWDVRGALGLLDAHTSRAAGSHGEGGGAGGGGGKTGGGLGVGITRPLVPVKTWSPPGAPTEGWALDWSRAAPGRLASGDCKGRIAVWDVDADAAARAAGGGGAGASGAGASPSAGASASSTSFASVWSVDGARPYKGHAGSVEDIQWSHTEAGVFASCGVDGTVRIWDTRVRDKSMLSVAAHGSGAEGGGVDVNVISWSRCIAFLLASGGDDGAFKVWDLRNFKSEAPIAHFKWHTRPITSLEWSPDDENVIMAGCSDNTVTLWDMSLEEDAEAEAAMGSAAAGATGEAPVPAQLLFVHAGQEDVKEARFHAQLPGVVFSTAADGFNIWKPDTPTLH